MARPAFRARTRRALLLLTLLCLGLIAPVGDVHQGSALARRSWPGPVKKALKTITARECFDHVNTLASDAYEGRAAGEAGARRASQYMARRFAGAGLEPGGLEGSWYQPFDLPTSPGTRGPLADVNHFEFGKKAFDARAKVYRYGEDYLPFAGSPDGIAAGDGLLIDARATEAPKPGLTVARSWSGRVLFLAGASAADVPAWLKAADARDARGVVLLSLEAERGWQEGEWPPPAESQPTAPLPTIHASRACSNKLLSKSGMSLKKLRKAPLSESFVMRKSFALFEVARQGQVEGRGRNVIAFYAGDDEQSDEAIVIGAHYDHVGYAKERRLSRGKAGEIHNGADDNSSGSAGLLEVAQAFVSGAVELRRSVIFIAFDAEEIGLLGSKHYVANPTFPIEKTVAMLNMDMISRNDPREMYLGKLDRFAGLNDIVESVASYFKIRLNPEGMAQYMNRSDQAPFIERDIPAVFLFGGMHGDYHTERDDANLVNPQKMEAIARLIFLFAVDAANHEGTFGS